jgi:hypothetical protein
MTAYAVSSEGTTAGSVAIKAGVYECRIASIEAYSSYVDGQWIYFYRYTGASMSGGSALSVGALRKGGPTASATASAGSVTVSGNSELVYQIWLGAGAVYTSGSGYQYSGFSDVFTPSLAFTIGPGSILVATPTLHTSTPADIWVNVYFEELRLQGCY